MNIESGKSWHGYDLDGTIAFYDKWRGHNHIGRPIANMVDHIKRDVANGIRVKIFTARVSESSLRLDGCTMGEALKPIETWCRKHLGFVPEITCENDCFCVKYYDDSAVPVFHNAGCID